MNSFRPRLSSSTLGDIGGNRNSCPPELGGEAVDLIFREALRYGVDIDGVYILGQFVSLFPDLKLLVVARHCHHPLSRLGDGVRGPTESSPDSIESFSLRAGFRDAL